MTENVEYTSTDDSETRGNTRAGDGGKGHQDN